MRYFNERNVIKQLKGYSKEQFKMEEVKTEKDGITFYKFTFLYEETKGYIAAIYNQNIDIYENIAMDCKFCRPAGDNNYPELKKVMDHIRFIFNV